VRITEHPILDIKKGKKVTIYFDAKPVEGFDDEPIAVTLYASGIKKLSESLKQHKPRGIFCCIGNCSSCLMKVDGIPNVRTCTKRISDGMIVEPNKRGA